MEQETKKIALTYKKANAEEWQVKGAELIKCDPKLVRFYVLTMHEGIYGVGNVPMSDIVNKIENENKNVFLWQLS